MTCPILETFDHWDPPIQTGNDTEYTLVILGLCVGGAAYLLARCILIVQNLRFAAKQSFALFAATFFLFLRPSFIPLADTSPPAAGHSATSFAFAAAIAHYYPRNPWLKWGAYALATGVTLSRYPAKKHYLSDILAGATIGHVTGNYLVNH